MDYPKSTNVANPVVSYLRLYFPHKRLFIIHCDKRGRETDIKTFIFIIEY